MKNYKLFILRLILFSFLNIFSQSLKSQNTDLIPYSTDSSHLTIWNGETYTPFFIKGINLGVSKPGTFPGELAASKEDYSRWFKMIKEAGFNCIRIYTLHYPRFYEALLEYNQDNPNSPLLFFQGVWLEEEIPMYDLDLFTLTSVFEQEIQDNINCVHGNNIIPERLGKASGEYIADVSAYVLGYIIGREIFPGEVITSNQNHPSSTSFNGEFLQVNNVNPAAAWMAEKLDFVIKYESENYQTQRPVSFSSWPTLDPISHPNEGNREEDTVTIDLSKIDYSNAKAGYFASYHAYPYYPDFISRDPKYQNTSDYIGQNSYLAYLNDLREYYSGIPLIIAEFGASSSWGIAHYAQNGIHHGGSNEVQQGHDYIRMFRNLQSAGTAGGMQFSWIDEWFKRTWITDPMDGIADRRILWHNITSAEQNFGLMGFRKESNSFELIESFDPNNYVKSIEASADFEKLNLKLNTNGFIAPLDTIWLAIDTYSDSLGESKMPNGTSIPHRSEFLMKIQNEEAELYVSQAYDLYGIWHGTSDSVQKYRSTHSDGAPWKIVRWKNNDSEQEVQFVGKLGLNRLNTPIMSTDAVIIDSTSISIHLPWTLINFTDPSELTVMDDNRNTAEREYGKSEGIAFSVFYKNEMSSTTGRFSWDEWQTPTGAVEYKKASYDIVKNELSNIPSIPIARKDEYEFLQFEENVVSVENGLLKNDWTLNNQSLTTYLNIAPKNGLLNLNSDGSFSYLPLTGFIGLDSFYYFVQAGNDQSIPVKVMINVNGNPEAEPSGFVNVFPNPSQGVFNIQSTSKLESLEVYNIKGQKIFSETIKSKNFTFDISDELPNIYLIKVTSRNDVICKKVVKQ